MARSTCPRACVEFVADERGYRCAWLAGEALLEIGTEKLLLRDAWAVRLERVTGWLVQLLEAGALKTVERAAAGRVLAHLGDPTRALFDSLGERMYNLLKKVHRLPFRLGLASRRSTTKWEKVVLRCRIDVLFGQDRPHAGHIGNDLHKLFHDVGDVDVLWAERLALPTGQTGGGQFILRHGTQRKVEGEEASVVQTRLSDAVEASSSTASGAARCPRGCSYPGHCRRYTDANSNGRCDLGESV